jgi:cytochrome c553
VIRYAKIVGLIVAVELSREVTMRIIAATALALLTLTASCSAADDEGEETTSASVEESLRVPGTILVRTPAGFSQTVGVIDTENPFFQSLGVNGRACVTCHQADVGWSISPRDIQRRFERSQGTDVLFLPHDVATSPKADVSTIEAKREAYKLLLSRGLVRVQIKMHAAADFELVKVEDPYGHASAAGLSLFRRPLPTTNLRFLSGVSWDGRKTFDGQTIEFGLRDQANGATVGHAQAPQPISEDLRAAMVQFETGIVTAQVWDDEVGLLFVRGASGGGFPLARQPFLTEKASPVFDLYDSWKDDRYRPRARVARGEALFNTRKMVVNGIETTCAGCHSAPNVGGSQAFRLFDIGVSARLDPELPRYTFRNKETGQEIVTSDPGRALITGKWADMNRFKVPILRSLAPRPPYFHNGSARDLGEVVDFYDARFGMGLTSDEKRDLALFLRVL